MLPRHIWVNFPYLWAGNKDVPSKIMKFLSDDFSCFCPSCYDTACTVRNPNRCTDTFGESSMQFNTIFELLTRKMHFRILSFCRKISRWLEILLNNKQLIIFIIISWVWFSSILENRNFSIQHKLWGMLNVHYLNIDGRCLSALSVRCLVERLSFALSGVRKAQYVKYVRHRECNE